MGFLKDFLRFIKHILNNHKLLVTLIKNDFKKQYLGSYFGLLWAFIQPIMYIVVIWLVFTFGFRLVDTSNEVPFALWLISGMIPWFFFATSLSGGVNSIVKNAYLVKKVAFRVSILPLVQLGSSLIIHLVLILLLMLVSFFYDYNPSLYWFQIFYYIFCSLILLIGLSWLTSSIRVFVKDIGNLIAVVIQIGFWTTPIFWNADKVPEAYHFVLNYNPMYYIVEGFRDTFINEVWFWEKPMEGLYFITISLITFILGAIIFRKLRPHFGDVL